MSGIRRKAWRGGQRDYTENDKEHAKDDAYG
jgi:hypothetical protein